MIAAETQRATWPDALDIDAHGHVTLDGVDLDTLARQRGTPLWAVSRSTVEGNYDTLRGSFRARYANCEIAYSIKAHNTLAVIRLVHRRGAPIDTSSEYEVRMALMAGVPPGDVIVNGNGKSTSALEQAARIGVRQVNVDSLDEARRLDRIAGELGVRVPCLVRVQLGYERLLQEDPSFESTLRIGEGKFGSNVASGQAFETIEAVATAANLDFLGLHHHVGFSGYMGDYTPEREVMHHRECTAEICAVANEARRRYGASVQRLDLGGGFRGGRALVLSTPGAASDVSVHALPAADDYADAIFGTIERDLEIDESPLVQLESGGYVIGNAVVMLVAVSEVKDVRSQPPRRFVSVDGSMMMFVSRGTMRVGHPVLPAVDPLREPDEIAVEVCGQTCVYDSIAEEIRLPALAPGNVLVLLNQGAYCETESTQFGGYPRPEVVLLHERTVATIKRRETLQDVVLRDSVPPELWTSP
jgi:diaminopimelate decarboxylase